MSVSPSLPIPDDAGLPTKVLDEREPIVSHLKEVLPADVMFKVSDGEVWANKALLSANSEYFSAMLDGEKFKEGREGVGDLEKKNKEVVTKLIHYFYSGEMSCKDLSLFSLLHLEDLLRLILLLPQSVKIQEFTKKKISLMKFSMPECLLGLVTADDLNLATTGDHLLQFINNNPGLVALSSSAVRCLLFSVPGAERAPPFERLNLICNRIQVEDEETQRIVLKSLDTSDYTKKELLDLLRKRIELVEKSHFSDIGLALFKDDIKPVKITKAICPVAFFPQHFCKLKSQRHG